MRWRAVCNRSSLRRARPNALCATSARSDAAAGELPLYIAGRCFLDGTCPGPLHQKNPDGIEKKKTQKVILMIKLRTWLWSASSFLRLCKSLVFVARRLSLRRLLLLLPLYLCCLPSLFLL